MSRHTYTLDEDKEVVYGFDEMSCAYFLEVKNLLVDEDEDIAYGIILEYSTSPMLLLTTKGKQVSRVVILEKLKELKCTNEDHLNAIALDMKF